MCVERGWDSFTFANIRNTKIYYTNSTFISKVTQDKKLQSFSEKSKANLTDLVKMNQ